MEMTPKRAGEVLASRAAAELQIGGNLVSFGKSTTTKNFIDESATAQQLSYKIENKTGKDQFIVFGGILPSFNPTMFQNVDEVLEAVSAKALFQDGVILSSDAGDLTVSSMDAKRKVNQLVRYAATSPLRVTKLSLKSAKLDGSKDSSNYDNLLKSYWVSPFENTVENEFNIRTIQQGLNNFNPDMLDIDFMRQTGSFKFIMSNENFVVMQINNNTVLTLTMFVGAQLSQAQRFHRVIKEADKVMIPALRAA